METIPSFAENPEIAAATHCHLPHPRGAKIASKDRHEAVFCIFYHTERAILETEGGEDPHDHAGKEQDRSGFLNEAPQTLPGVHENGLGRRDVVCR